MNQMITIIRRNWLPLLGLNSVLLAATIYAATVYAGITSSSNWKASAQLNLPETKGGLSADLGPLGSLQNGGLGFSKEVNPLQIQSAIITSDLVLSRVRETDPEKNLYPDLNNYKSLFTVIPLDQATVIALEAEGTNSELAHQRLTRLIQVYQQRLNELRHDAADIREQFARQELGQARADLAQAQSALTQFQQSTGIVDKDGQTKGLVDAINALKGEKAAAMAESKAVQTEANEAAARLGMSAQQAMNSLRLAENKEYQAVRDKVSQVETALAEARGNYTEASPQVQSLLEQRQELRRDLSQRATAAIPNATGAVDTTLGGNSSRDSRIEMITELVQTQTAAKGQQQRASQIQGQLSQLNNELSSITANQSKLADLQRKYETAEGVYKGIIAQIEQPKTNPFNAYPSVQILDAPTTNSGPSKPKRWLIVLGGVLASIFGSIALVSLRESRNPLLSPKDLQQVELPVLVSIPRLKYPAIEQHLEADLEIEFQQLASAISSMMLQNQRLMVTSSTFGEGKTTVTLGLALALANFGFRVLIVDGDLRQAEMSRRLGRSQTKIDLIETKAKQTVIRVHPGLDLVPAPLIPKEKIAEFFARGSFESRLNAIQNTGNYDYVLVDSPPVSLTIEPSLMSSVVQNVLFVVRPGTSDRYSVMDGFEQLTRHSARITGLVVNGVESRTQGYRYGRQRELLEAEA